MIKTITAYNTMLEDSDAASGWAGWALAHPNGLSVTPFQPGKQSIPTALLIAHPELKT